MMNRISEVRDGAGLSISELARLVGTSPQQMSRLESGERRLTVEWLQKIAVALDCTIAELLLPPLEGLVDDVEPVEPASADVAAALGHGKVALYRVLSDSLSNLGINSAKNDPDARSVITVDQKITNFAQVKTGDAVLVRMSFEDRSVQVLRQFVGPNMITTNRRGTNTSFLLDDEFVRFVLLGLVLS